MWLTIRPPDNPFDKVYYYYDYNIQEATEEERPDHYNKDADLRNQRCFIITFKTKIEIDPNNRFKIEFNDSDIFSEWNRDHSKEIKKMVPSIRRRTVKYIFEGNIK
jgi:hypothetical protein